MRSGIVTVTGQTLGSALTSPPPAVYRSWCLSGRPLGISKPDGAGIRLFIKGGAAHFPDHRARKPKSMLETIAIILLVLWILGLVTSYTIGGFIHLLLVLAVVLFLIRIVQGRSAL